MNNKDNDYIQRFLNLSEATTGKTGYFTLKVPIAVNEVNHAKLRDASNAFTFIWNRLTEHQESAGWNE